MRGVVPRPRVELCMTQQVHESQSSGSPTYDSCGQWKILENGSRPFDSHSAQDKHSENQWFLVKACNHFQYVLCVLCVLCLSLSLSLSLSPPPLKAATRQLPGEGHSANIPTFKPHSISQPEHGQAAPPTIFHLVFFWGGGRIQTPRGLSYTQVSFATHRERERPPHPETVPGAAWERASQAQGV